MWGGVGGMWEKCESTYLPNNLQLGYKRTVSTYLTSWSLHTHPPTFKGYMKEMWVYLECTYITTFRGNERAYLAICLQGDMRELWVYLSSYQPSRGMWESHASTYLSLGGYKRTVSLSTKLPTNLQEGCERTVSHIPTSLPFMGM